MAYTYTAAEFDDIKVMHASGSTLEEIVAKYPDKSVASVRMKLVKAGVYNAKSTAKQPKKEIKTNPATQDVSYTSALAAVGEAPF